MKDARFLSARDLPSDHPLIVSPPPRPEIVCEQDWLDSWGSHPPIRLQPSEPFAGSSGDTDRIISRWRPKIFTLVEQANGMAKDLCEISWRGSDEPYPYCNFLKLLEPTPGTDMRRFTDEACHILLQALTRDEIIEEAFWPDHRKPDARDVMEWLERWSVWLPDEKGQFHFWSIFMPCDVLEAFYRYVHGLVHDAYFEILDLHMQWEDKSKNEVATGHALSPPYGAPPEVIIYWHPRLVLDDREITLTSENAEELRDWSYDAFCSWKSRITQEQKEALVMLGYEADQLSPSPRWPD